MLFFIVLFLIILFVSVPIYKKFRNRNEMSSLLIDSLKDEISSGSYFDTEISNFIDGKSISMLKKNGHKGYDDDLRRLPEYQVFYNVNIVHINKYLLHTEHGCRYFSSDFIDYVHSYRSFAHKEAFKSVLSEFFLEKMSEENNHKLRKSVETKNAEFSKEFDKQFMNAQEKLSQNPVLNENTIVSAKTRDVLKRYVNQETLQYFQRKRLKPTTLYGEFSSDYNKEYKRRYSDLDAMFFEGDRFSKKFLQFVKTKYGSKHVNDFEKLIPLYIKYQMK